MADYKKMYLKAMGALADADILLESALERVRAAQLECENIFAETDNMGEIRLWDCKIREQ